MYRPLIPCPTCARHVLASETNCPFCSTVLPTDLASRAIPAAGTRLNRAAAFVFGASLAVTGCSSEVDTGGSGGSGSSGSSGSSSSTGGSEVDSGVDDDGGVAPLYGDPPPDDGGNAAMYGTPPPLDAGTDAMSTDDGGGVPLYGAPPPNP